eukprot:2608434-Pyramimonas_sp.AAC.1
MPKCSPRIHRFTPASTDSPLHPPIHPCIHPYILERENIAVVVNRCNAANRVYPLCTLTVHLYSRSVVGVEAFKASSLDQTTPASADSSLHPP